MGADQGRGEVYEGALGGTSAPALRHAAMTPHEVRHYGVRNFFLKGFLLCGLHSPTSVSPSRPGTGGVP